MSNAASDFIAAHGLVPVHANSDADAAIAVLRACHAGGIRVFEYTNRTANALDVFSRLRVEVNESMPDLLLGAGTILDSGTASAYSGAGADFIVSPVASEDVGAWCLSEGVTFIPGIATASELVRATSLGATLVKLFPAADLGVGYLKRLLGPLPHSRVMVTGGISATREDVTAWLDAGAVAVGLGSDLVPSGVLTDERLKLLTKVCSDLIEAFQMARSE